MTALTFVLSMMTVGKPAIVDHHENLLIGHDTVVTDSITMDRSVTITGGATLWVQGTVYFNTGCSLTIDRGARLILDGGTLTSSCTWWQGIELWGTYNQPQTLPYQGYVKLINGARIGNSVCGIRAIRKVDAGEGSFLPEYSGGIIFANDAYFVNNETDVEFYSYPDYNSISYFRDCHFTTGEDNPVGFQPGYHIRMTGIDGISFTNCYFSDERDMMSITPDNRQSGILSNTCTFSIEDDIITDPPNFHHLFYGIKSMTSSPAHPADIEGLRFTENVRSLYLGSGENHWVALNDFTVWPDNITMKTYCMYLDQCTGYTVEENQFVNTGQVRRGIGLIVNHSGLQENEIYNNYFDFLSYGMIAQNQNRGASTGLQVKCNEFINCGFDLSVTADMSYDPLGIAPVQGSPGSSPDAPAGNRFSWTGPEGTPTDMNNQCEFVTYYYHDATPQLHLQPVYFTSETVEPVPNYEAQWNPESCASHLCSGGGGGTGEEALKGEMAATEQKADSVMAIIDLLEDGGNTATTKWNVDMSAPPQAMNVYNDLMGKSPYLSDTVIGAAIEKENVLVEVMIRDVMVANPESAKNGLLLQKLDERANPLPEYMLDQILQGRSLVSYYGELLTRYSYYCQKRASAFKRLAHYYMTDTVSPVSSLDSLTALYQRENSLDARYNTAFLQLERGQVQAGHDLLSGIPLIFSLTPEQVQEHDRITELYDMNASGNGFSPDSLQMSALFDIASSGQGNAAAYARNVLLALDEITYEEPVLLPDETKSSEIREYAVTAKMPGAAKMLEVFPVPAKDHIVIHWKLGSDPAGAVIRITGGLGQPVDEITVNVRENQVVMDTRGMDAGIYYAEMRSGNQMLEMVKFVIAR